MGWLDALRDTLGWKRPPPQTIQDPTRRLGFTAGALQRLAALPPGHGIHVSTVAIHRGRAVHVTEGLSEGPPPPGFVVPLTASDADLGLLVARDLDFHDGRWLLAVSLDLRARETPNPDSRLYLADQVLGIGKPAFFVASDEPDAKVPDLAARLLEVPSVLSVLLRESTVTIARAPGASWDDLDRGVDAALRAHLLSLGAPVDGGADSGVQDPIVEEIRAVLAERVLPGIHRDGGDLEIVGFSHGVLKVSMVGACRSCPASSATLKAGVERTLQEAFPGRVTRIEQV